MKPNWDKSNIINILVRHGEVFLWSDMVPAPHIEDCAGVCMREPLCAARRYRRCIFSHIFSVVSFLLYFTTLCWVYFMTTLMCDVWFCLLKEGFMDFGVSNYHYWYLNWMNIKFIIDLTISKGYLQTLRNQKTDLKRSKTVRSSPRRYRYRLTNSISS